MALAAVELHLQLPLAANRRGITLSVARQWRVEMWRLAQNLMQPVGHNFVVARHQHIGRNGNSARHLIGPCAVRTAQHDARFGIKQMCAHIFAGDAELRAIPVDAQNGQSCSKARRAVQCA